MFKPDITIIMVVTQTLAATVAETANFEQLSFERTDL